jgi:hypothetical protein
LACWLSSRCGVLVWNCRYHDDVRYDDSSRAGHFCFLYTIYIRSRVDSDVVSFVARQPDSLAQRADRENARSDFCDDAVILVRDFRALYHARIPVRLWNGGSGDPKLSVFPWMHMLVRQLPIRPAEKPDQIGSEHDEEESWQPV